MVDFDLPDIEVEGQDIAALNCCTEGWIAGWQLAALSLGTQSDAHDFVQNFTGRNRYVLDYLFEEVFQQQSAALKSMSMVLRGLPKKQRALPPRRNDVTGCLYFSLKSLRNSSTSSVAKLSPIPAHSQGV